MKAKYAVVAMLLLASVIAVTPAQATTIVDTGPGVGNDNNDWLLDPSQSLAAAFVTTQAWIITGIEGWITPGVGDVTYVLYSDGGEVPGVELFSQTITISGGSTGFIGPTGLSWFIGPGTYWAAFEVRPGSTFAGSMPGGSPNPLIDEAFTFGGTYFPFDGLDLGVRIFADEPNGAAVPEPASLFLLGTGAAGLLAIRARRQSRT